MYQIHLELYFNNQSTFNVKLLSLSWKNYQNSKVITLSILKKMHHLKQPNSSKNSPSMEKVNGKVLLLLLNNTKSKWLLLTLLTFQTQWLQDYLLLLLTIKPKIMLSLLPACSVMVSYLNSLLQSQNISKLNWENLLLLLLWDGKKSSM